MLGFLTSRDERQPVQASPLQTTKTAREEVQDLARALGELSRPEDDREEQAPPAMHADAEQLAQLLSGRSSATFRELSELVERISGQLQMLDAIISDPTLRAKLQADVPAAPTSSD